MTIEIPDLWEFGEFRLDVHRKVLWHRELTVSMPLKQLELLSMLVRHCGQLVTKDEIIHEIWKDSFVEESNLSRHIYLLRKTLREQGAGDDLIENVPRRGYRFTGEARMVDDNEVVVEQITRTRTRIELQVPESPTPVAEHSAVRTWLAALGILAILLVSVYLGFRAFGTTASVAPVRSIAVLPFRSLTDSAGAELGAGLADILTTRLSTVRDLKIRPFSGAMQVGADDPLAAGQKLQVDAILEGTIYQMNDRVRVTARLIRVSEQSIIWSGEFEKLKNEAIQLQDELALQIVSALTVNLSANERSRLAKRYTESEKAYAMYLKGRYEWNKRSIPDMVEAQRLFRNAIEADPNFALAYAGLADSLLMFRLTDGETNAIITKALELDPNLAEAHASRGFYLMFHEWKWDEAERSFKTSLEINPNYVTAHQWYATLLAIRGNTEAAKAEMYTALELNPVSYNLVADLGQLHYFSGDYEEAEKYCLKALEIYPNFTFAYGYLHSLYLKTGQFEKAVLAVARADKINGTFAHDRSNGSDPTEEHVRVFRERGIKGYLDYRLSPTETNPATFYLHAMKYALFGDDDKALDYLEKATDRRIFLSAFAKAEPIFEKLRDKPRYQAILRKMDLEN